MTAKEKEEWRSDLKEVRDRVIRLEHAIETAWKAHSHPEGTRSECAICTLRSHVNGSEAYPGVYG